MSMHTVFVSRREVASITVRLRGIADMSNLSDLDLIEMAEKACQPTYDLVGCSFVTDPTVTRLENGHARVYMCVRKTLAPLP